MITERTNQTRFERKQETKSILNYIHGGTSNAVSGAWDFELMDQFVTGYRKGKFIQDKFNDITKKYESSDESLKKAVALKYQNFLCLRKYNFLPQTMDSFYDP